VPVAFTPNEDEPDEEVEGEDPDDEHAAAAASSMTAAAPVRLCLGESFIAVSCLVTRAAWGAKEDDPVAKVRKPFSQKLGTLRPTVNPLAQTGC
jgi:hypothetical protein